MLGVKVPGELAIELERTKSCRACSELELRPRIYDQFPILTEAGVTVWYLTTGNTKRVRGYFERTT